MSSKLRSFHQFRYQEMKKIKQLVTLQREEDTESKQQLNKCAEDDSTSPRPSKQNTSKVVPIIYWEHEKEKTLEVAAEKDETVKRMLEVIEEDSDADSTEQQPQEELSTRNGSKEVKSGGEEEEQNDDMDDGDDTDACRLISIHDGPGSPSFRVYCIQSFVDKEDEGSDNTFVFDDSSNDLDDSEEQASYQRTTSWDDIESLISRDNADEVADENEKKQKKKKFMMAIKGRPFSLRNLLNVKKIYNQSNKHRSISNPNN